MFFLNHMVSFMYDFWYHICLSGTLLMFLFSFLNFMSSFAQYSNGKDEVAIYTGLCVNVLITL
jgi:hypothetical protein